MPQAHVLEGGDQKDSSGHWSTKKKLLEKWKSQGAHRGEKKVMGSSWKGVWVLNTGGIAEDTD